MAPGEYPIKSFETQANVPNVAGVIPAGSSFLLRLYMDKTADSGAMNTLVKVYKNSTAGTLMCTGSGFALTTTRGLHTFLCVVSSNVTFTASDRYFVSIGVNVTTAPTVNNRAELSIEQNWDSRISVNSADGAAEHFKSFAEQRFDRYASDYHRIELRRDAGPRHCDVQRSHRYAD